MDWSGLVTETAQRTGQEPAQLQAILDAFFTAVMKSMKTDRLVILRPDFGYFELREALTSSARKRRVLVFHPSGRLKARLEPMRENIPSAEDALTPKGFLN
jgi:hypothetical protein